MKREFYTQYTKIPPVQPVVNDKPSLTWQHCKDECDIMHIVKKPNLGINPFNVPDRKPLQGDFSTALDFQSAQNLIVQAKEQFASMPSSIRDRFGNDPAKMLSFVEDPKNLDECIRLGIYEKVETSTPVDDVTLLNEMTKGPTQVTEPGKAGSEPISGSSEIVRTSNT